MAISSTMDPDIYSSELVLLSAPDAEGLAASAVRLASFLEQAPAASLRDVAFTCARAFVPGSNSVLAVVADSTADLRARLLSATSRISAGTARIRDRSGTYYVREHMTGPGTEGRLAFVFPGVAAFYPGMLRDLAIRFPVCRAAFDELEEALASAPGPFVPSSFVFPPAPYYRRDADVFSAGGYAEAMVAVFAANAAMRRLFAALGVVPEAVVGYSGGDLNAFAAGGVLGTFPRPDRLEFLRDMYHVVDSAVAHAGLPRCVMASLVSPHPEKTDEVLASFPPDKVTLSFAQSPRHRTVAIAPDCVAEVQRALVAVGVRGMRLPVDRPFNTVWCSNILPAFRKFASRWVCASPRVPVWSCGHAAPVPEKPRKVRDVASGQWAEPVRFEDTVRAMHAAGCRVFLEAGPRGVASNSIDEILKGETFAAVAANGLHRTGFVQFLHAVGQLASLGVAVNPAVLFSDRRARALDFGTPLALEVRADAELRLRHEYPRLVLPFGETLSEDGTHQPGTSAETSPAVGGGRARRRAAARAEQVRRWRQFDAGAARPLVSDAETVSEKPGESCEIAKELTFADSPLLADAAFGTSRLAYSDTTLRAFTPLTLAVGAEIMAELAQNLVPNRHLVAVEDLLMRRMAAFSGGRLKVCVRAVRVPSHDPSRAMVKVQLRDDAPNAAWTWPVMEATCVFSEEPAAPAAFVPARLPRPRTVHWTERDIYPGLLPTGERLQGIRKADLWSEAGIDYEVAAPAAGEAVAHTRFPVWAINPQLLATVTDGFALWRAHERLAGALSFGFRIRRLVLYADAFTEGTVFKCYLRLTDATPQTHVADIAVSDGNGNLALEIRGYEERVERVPAEYRRLVLSPETAFLTRALPSEAIGSPDTPVATAVVTNVPYPLFGRNEELWLKTVSQIVLGAGERRAFADQKGSTERRAEWLFGRIAAKEAMRRFLLENYQARWNDADVQIWSDDSGKPHPIGAWQDFLSAKVDLAIAHTARFVVAVVAANARAGVDVEARDRDLSEEFINGVFGPEEQNLAAEAADAPGTMIRFWCAKEAVSKALGTGIRYSPKELVVASYLPESGEIGVALAGQWLEAFKMFRGRTIRVDSSLVEGHMLASCFIPESLFGS